MDNMDNNNNQNNNKDNNANNGNNVSGMPCHNSPRRLVHIDRPQRNSVKHK